jgi:hypothetical protein
VVTLLPSATLGGERLTGTTLVIAGVALIAAIGFALWIGEKLLFRMLKKRGV